MLTQNTSKNISGFYCEVCDFKCCKKGDWGRHILTAKHINAYNLLTNATTITSINKYECECGCSYTHRQSLHTHKKKCNLNDNIVQSSNINETLVIQLLKQNQDFKELIMEQNKTIIDAIKQNNSITNNINQVNCNNTFNLNLFLHEHCKDAMNINEFLDSINFQLSDLEHMGRVGYVEGIAKLIITNLNALDVTKRPIHCTDPKRETIYIKDGDVWIKEDADNKNVRKLIKRVAFRNSKSIRLYKEKYPECRNPDSRYSDTFNKIVLEAMGGGSKCDDYDSENKIIRKLTKVITIDKSDFLTKA